MGGCSLKKNDPGALATQMFETESVSESESESNSDSETESESVSVCL